MQISFPILVLLISFKGINLIVEEDKKIVKGFFKDIFITLILLIITPYLLSISIIFVNTLSLQFTNGESLTGYIISFIEEIEKEQFQQQTEEDNKLKEFFSFNFNPFETITEIIGSLPLLIPLILILIVFLYLSFQFILRFLNLYFLAIIYPLVIVFYVHPKAKTIINNYIKTWTTFLIHQPVFILGIAIVQQVLKEMLSNNGISLEQILIFLGMLIFLASINNISARIWGDVYSSTASALSSAVGTGLVISTGINSASLGSKFIKSMKNTPNIINTGKSILDKAKDVSQIYKNFNDKNKKNDPNISEKIYPSANKDNDYTEELREKGFKTNKINEYDSIIGLSGDFYANNKPRGGITSLYTSKEDAVLDGMSEENIEKVNLRDIKIRDTSDENAIDRYNRKVDKYARQICFEGNTNLSKSSNKNRVLDNLNIGRSYNKVKGVEGIVIKRLAKNGKRGDEKDKINKIYLYNNAINKSEKS